MRKMSVSGKVTGSGNTHIATLVDRKTRFSYKLKLAGKDATSVNNALIAAISKMPPSMKQSLTWDRGMALAKHAEFTKSIGIPVYFCDPQSSWQRGTNANTNGLIRQYFPKKTCLGQHLQTRLNDVANQLKERSRKTLRFKTPKRMVERCVALTN